MVSLEWSTDRTGGVTLVSLWVESQDRARRVRVENRTGGPVWPPRRQGRPAAGWDDTGFTGVVEADGSLALGYATSGEPAEPPAEVVASEPLADQRPCPDERPRPDGSPTPDTAGGSGEEVAVENATPSGVVRSLGDPVVPREAVPVPGGTADENPGGPTRPPHDGSLSARLAAVERRLAAIER